MSDRPNAIVFFTDQHRWDASGLHGNPLDLMPNFDRLARRGTHVPHGFTCQPLCVPARACLQTGQHATTNNGRLDPGSPTLAGCFREAGYRTGYIGKWHLARGESGLPQEIRGPVPEAQRGGYRDWLASNVLEFTSDAYQTRMYDENDEPVDLPGYRVDALTDAAIRYVSRRAREEDPFFLMVSYVEPHHQNHVDDYPPPVGYRERYAGRWTPPDLAALGGTTGKHLGGYWGMVKRLDEALGRLQDALISLGLDQNTIVLFTADHGCHFKTRHGEYKRSGHESSIHVPMALWGGPFEGGGQRPELVSLVDLPPTLLEAAGVAQPEAMEGRSLLRRMRGQDPDWPEELFVQTSGPRVGRTVRTHRWKYIVEIPKEEAEGVYAARRYEEAELYDLRHDPYELTNLIHSEAHAPVRDAMRDRMLRRMRAIGEAEPAIVRTEPRRMGQRVLTDGEEWQ